MGNHVMQLILPWEFGDEIIHQLNDATISGHFRVNKAKEKGRELDALVT